MADTYAKDARLRDDRVQELAFNATAGVTFTQQAYTESHRLATATTQIGGTVQDLKRQVEAGKIDMATYEKSVALLRELNSSEYGTIKREAEEFMSTGATTDIKAAAEIIKGVAEKKEVEKKKEEQKIPVKFSSWRDHLGATFRIKLVKVDPTIDKKRQAELDRRIEKEGAIRTAVATKYSKTFTLADKLLKAKAAASEEMGGPVQKTATKYSSL